MRNIYNVNVKILVSPYKEDDLYELTINVISDQKHKAEAKALATLYKSVCEKTGLKDGRFSYKLGIKSDLVLQNVISA